MPDAWHAQAVQGMDEDAADFQTWWNVFDDPVLDSLIRQSGVDNLDLQIAAARVKQSRALLGVASGEYWPNVDGVGFYNRFRGSENGLFSGLPVSSTDELDLYSVGVDASWEIDVFGRISRSVESARAFYESSIENYRDVLVILYADVAFNYVEVRTLQARIQYALENIRIQRDTMGLTEDRFEAGLVPELDVQQAHLNLADTESTVPSLRSQQTAAVNRLSVLLGQRPGQIHEALMNAAPIPDAPKEVVIGLPAELLRQRPDIRFAERTLAGQTAQIGAAEAGLYPIFSLSGTFALEAQDFDDLGDWSSRTWGFGPAFRWNLFDGNRVKSVVQLQEARTEEALIQYEQTILVALEEVEDAMVAFQEEQIRREALQRSVTAAAKSVDLVNELYREGLTDFQNVLDTQRSLTEQQDKLAESEGQVVLNLILLYKALGGGWALDETTSDQ